jgi:quinoprotein glucose dehydrogenase
MWNLERLWVPHFEGQAAYILPPIANIGDGPSGVVYDYAGTYSPVKQGMEAMASGGPAHRFLMAYFKGTSAKSGVYSVGVRPRGASFEVVAHDEFIWNSLVPDVDIGPDGAVWFADWHEGWPKSNKGRIYRAFQPGLESNPAIQETRRLLAEGMTRRGAGELLALLTHPDMRVRQEAQFELAGRGVSSVEGLRRTALQPGPVLSRVHALWAFSQIERTERQRDFAADWLALVALLDESDPEIRAQVCQVLGESRWAGAADAVAKRLRDSSERVRFVALQSLATLCGVAPGASVTTSMRALATKPFSAAVEAAIETFLKTEPSSPMFLTAGQRALNTAGSIRKAFEFGERTPNGSRLYPYSGLLAARRMKHESAGLFLGSRDPLLVLEAARAVNDAPIATAIPQLASLGKRESVDALLRQFASLNSELHPLKTQVSPGSIRDVRADQPLPWTNAPVDFLTPLLLRVVNANFCEGTPETAARLASLATRGDLSEWVRSEAIFALATWSKPAQRDRVTGTYRPIAERDASPARASLEPQLASLLSSGPVSLRVAAADAAVRLESKAAIQPLTALLMDLNAPAPARASALRALASLKAPGIADALRFGAADRAEAVRLEASKLNAELNPNDAAGQLSAKLTSGSIAEQQAAFESLGNLKSDSADAILAEWLDKLIKREVANEVMLDLVEAAAKRKSGAVRDRLAAYNDWKLPKDHLTPWRETMSGGDADRGRKVFYERQEVACTRCHKIGTDGGGDVGPNLSGIATRGTVEHVLESIVFPNKQIADGFESVLITLKNGASHAGVLKGETAAELTVNSPEDGVLVLKKSDVTTRERGLSGMPEGMGQLLTKQELRDLIQFLGTLR